MALRGRAGPLIPLASGLLALAGVFAERAIASTRCASLHARLGVRPPPGQRHGRMPSRGMVALAAIGLLVAAGPAPTVVAIAAALVAERIVRRRRRHLLGRRREDQLADAVSAVCSALRAGLSLPQALAYARDEAEPPLRDDLGRLVGRIEVGVPVGTALAGWADELASEDVRLLVGVLELHRRSGGDLPSVLDGVAGTLRERRASHREVRALTAQARLSGAILGTLPIGFFGFLFLTSRREMLGAIATPIGRVAVAVGVGLELVAFVWIRRLLEVR